MIHATSRQRCEEVARELSGATGVTDYQPLYSTREYKKTRVRYFVEDYELYRQSQRLAPAKADSLVEA
jgi:hypothetical protein